MNTFAIVDEDCPAEWISQNVSVRMSEIRGVI